MTHSEYLQARIGKRIDYDGAFKYQCVDLVRHYMDLVQGYKSGTFSWSAYKGFMTWSPFDNTWGKKKSGNLKIWDVIFRWPSKANWGSGHVAIIDHVAGSILTVIEQNGVGSGNWLWNNAIRLQQYPLKWIIWRYTRAIKIDKSDPKTIAIRKLMKSNGQARTDAEAVLVSPYIQLQPQTQELIKEQQNKLNEVNGYLRGAGY